MRTTALITLIIATATAAAAEQRAGEARSVQPDAYMSRGSQIAYPIDVGADIYLNTRVQTRQYGSIDINFDDGTSLTVAPNASLVIDEYVYAGAQKPGALTLSLAKGALRVVSGRMSKESYRINAPTATIGVRGTDFWLDSDDPERLKIWIDDGVVAAQPTGADTVFAFEAPSFALCTPIECVQADAPPRPVAYPLDPSRAANVDQPESESNEELDHFFDEDF